MYQWNYYLIENHTETNTEYELTGITIHYGVADFGHYYDLIKGNDGKWYKFNDISVSEFKEEDIPREAYGEKEIFEEDSSKEKESGKNIKNEGLKDLSKIKFKKIKLLNLDGNSISDLNLLEKVNFDTEEDYELNGGEKYFGVEELEVFQVKWE